MPYNTTHMSLLRLFGGIVAAIILVIAISVGIGEEPAAPTISTEAPVISLNDTEPPPAGASGEEPEEKPEEEGGAESSVPVSPEPEHAAPGLPQETPPAVSGTIPSVTEDAESMPVSFSAVNEAARRALVNILCTTKSGGALRPISGSGVLIDPRGVILTNTHIAQYYLLENYQVPGFLSCAIRTGSPARPQYRATALFIHPEWIRENADNIVSDNPTGTGENDFALLLIDRPVSGAVTLPDAFPYVKADTQLRSVGVSESLLLAAYPAGFIGNISVERNLYLASSIAEVVELFTFGRDTLDLFSLGGSVVAQKGSSGGAAVNDKGELVGLIVTSTDAETTGGRDLHAISLEHVDRSLQAHAGETLSVFLSGDLAERARVFNTRTAPALTELLVAELDR